MTQKNKKSYQKNAEFHADFESVTRMIKVAHKEV
jgi:hypothetical protein